METSEFYNLSRLFKFRDVLEGLDPAAAPRAILVEPSQDFRPSRVGIVAGAFNPPTLAHVELARFAKQRFQLDHVCFSLSRITIEKEQADGLVQEDRMLLMWLLAGSLGWASLAAVNKGLYFEQARAYRSLFGNNVRIFFVVGMDKVLQIFDPRYYQDRDKALKELFTETQLIVANRGSLGEQELKKLLGQKENQVYEDRVYPLTLPENLKELTSTELRQRIAHGQSVRDLLPDVVDQFVVECRGYQREYGFRLELLNHLYGIKEWAVKVCNFEALIRIAAEETHNGEKLREMLLSENLSSPQLKDTISNLPDRSK
ncbi:MAG: hypothetical protein GTO40_09745 [Deltaproteobacteria bacterium]|nr:hypothetical protein [Deltaproteobacteria bacterium]